jgi:hypothetical protein
LLVALALNSRAAGRSTFPAEWRFDVIDLDRRSFVLGTTAGAAALAASAVAPALTEANLCDAIARSQGLTAELAPLIASRLHWSGRWPDIALHVGGDQGVEILASPGLRHLTVRQHRLPKDALVVLWGRGSLSQRHWRAVAGTETAICGRWMTAARSGDATACVIRRRRAVSSFELIVT